MEQVTAYKDNTGRLYKTEKEARKSEILHKYRSAIETRPFERVGAVRILDFEHLLFHNPEFVRDLVDEVVEYKAIYEAN